MFNYCAKIVQKNDFMQTKSTLLYRKTQKKPFSLANLVFHSLIAIRSRTDANFASRGEKY